MEMEDYESLIGENNVLDEYMREFQENDTMLIRQKRMKRGRCCITTFNWLYLALIVILCGFVMQPEEFGDPDWGTMATVVGVSYPVLFALLFILLAITVFTLIKRLKVKNETLGTSQTNDNFFTKEINTLSIILILFSISYLLRVVFDLIAVMPFKWNPFR